MLNIEKSIEAINSQVNKFKSKKNEIYYSIDKEFIASLKKQITFVSKEVYLDIFSFFGFDFLSKKILKVTFFLNKTMLNDEGEMRSLLKTSEKLSDCLNIGKADLKEKVTKYKNSNVAFPLNLICDYILFHYEIHALEKEKEHLNTQKEKV